MNKIIYSLLACISMAAIMGNSDGVFTQDYTGTSGFGQSCAQGGCHIGIGTMGVDSNKLRVRVLDASNVDVNSYRLNQPYTVEIRFKLDGATKVGFQCTNLFFFSGAKAGTINNTIMPSLVQVNTISGREYASHTLAGNGSAVISGGYAIWRYNWVAPSVATAAISFNCTVNRSNNSGTEFGDSIFTSVNKILQLPTSVANHAESELVALYPNPCSNHLYIKSDKLYTSYKLTDIYGRSVQSGTIEANSIDVASVQNGMYLLWLQGNDSLILKQIVKQ